MFKRFDRWSGDERYIYHGNDGTSFPWNDTAQLDFLKPEVREHVIQVILDVARRFPIIRFDAAMVLAKKHIQRLWWPLPGAGDGIPSRAEHAMSQADFDAHMPVEFWREVVDRVAAEVPGTLLLAEAFWMLEGYFVRTLGMHRVYNSAFMHMLRDEDGAGYRRLIKETLEFDPEILKRYVNFMSNPDEATAVEQFGKGDKYIGVAMVMATLPGLPMLGHGQIEGFGEKYGMEFRRATRDEQPDPWLVERHERELFPLLHRRAWFAEADDFLLYDFVDRRRRRRRVASSPTPTAADRPARWSSITPASARPPGRSASRRPMPARTRAAPSAWSGARWPRAWACPTTRSCSSTFRDARTGLEYLRSAREIWERGLWLRLDAYEGHVFWEFREVVDGSAGQWRRLAERLGGAGVPSLEAALRDLQLEPVHVPLRALFDGPEIAAVLDGRATPADLDALERGLRGASWWPWPRRPGWPVRAIRRPSRPASATRAEAAFALLERPVSRSRSSSGRRCWAGWPWPGPGELAPRADVAATSLAWYDELRLAPVVAGGFRAAGLEEGARLGRRRPVRVLLALTRPSEVKGRGAARDTRLLERWLARARRPRGDGRQHLAGRRVARPRPLRTLLDWAVRLDAIEAGRDPDRALVDRLGAAAAAAGYRVDRLLAAGADAGPVGDGAAPAGAADAPADDAA